MKPFKAALLTAHNQPLMFGELTNERLSYGQVLVKVLASGICGAQLQEIAGQKASGPMPHPLGHEGCGEVVEIGPAVTRVGVGDRVVMHWRKGEGIESEFPRYRLGGQPITGGKVTTFSEYSVCSENRLTRVPESTPPELCALLGCGLSTALGVIETEAQLMMGETVLIIGCGGLGLNLIRAAKMRLASAIICCDVNESKESAALAAGATDFCCAQQNWAAQCDVVIDTTGSEIAISKGLECLSPSGRFIMVGQPALGQSVLIPRARNLFNGEGCSIKATQGGQFNPTHDIPRYVQLHQAGLLSLEGIITHRFPLDFINDGIDLVRNGNAGRIIITP